MQLAVKFASRIYGFIVRWEILVLQKYMFFIVTVAEYAAGSEVCKQDLWIYRQVGDLGFTEIHVLHCDSGRVCSWQ